MLSRTIRLQVKKLALIPNDLRRVPTINAAKDLINVDWDALMHHHYVDKWREVPVPGVEFDQPYRHFLASTADLRFRGAGLGGGHRGAKGGERAKQSAGPFADGVWNDSLG